MLRDGEGSVPVNREYDALVVGGGHNGLVCACYLARAGLEVAVLEAGPQVGGMSGTAAHIAEAPNHLINHCAVDVIFMRATGIIEELDLRRFGYREVESEPVNVYLHGDGPSIAFWRDPSRTADEIRQFSRSDAEGYLDLVRLLDGFLDVGLPMFLTRPTRPDLAAIRKVAGALLRRRRDLGKIGSLLVSSAAQLIDERFSHPVVRDAMATQCGVAGPITAEASSLSLILLPFYARCGAGRPVGGIQALPDALAAALRTLGGTILTGAVVEEVLVQEGRAVGVRLHDGAELRARRAVVATCDPRTALGTLLPSGTLDQALEARVAHIPTNAEGIASIKIDLALSGRVRIDRHQALRRDGLDLRHPSIITGGYESALSA